MALLAYNKTASPLLLAAGSPAVTLPAASSAGARGRAVDVTAELQASTSGDFALLQVQVAAGSVEFEWTVLPEFNTYTLIVGSAAQDIGENDVLIYADSAAGNDANPGTAAQPVQTLLRAFQLLPMTYKKRCVLSLVGTGFTFPANFRMFVPQPVGPTASPFLMLGSFTNELGTVTSTAAGSQFVLTAGALALPVDGYRRAYLFCVTGPAGNVGQRRMITSNTATTITTNKRFTSAIGIGDTFIVERPAVTITLAGTGSGIVGNGAPMGWKGLNFVSPTGPFAPRVFAITKVSQFYGEGIGVNSVRFFLFSSELSATSTPALWNNDGVNNPFSALRTAAGWGINGGGVTAMNGSNHGGSYVADLATFDGVAAYDTFNGRSINIFSEVNNTITMIQGPPTPRSIITGDLFGDPSLGLVTVDANSTANLFSIDLAGNTVGSGLAIYTGSYVNMNDVGGAGNARYGIELNGMSSADTNGTCTVTGTLGDMLVGAVPKAYAALPFSENGTLASGTAASTGAVNTFTGLTGAALTNANVGDILTTSGFATGTNNDTWKIIAVLSATSCTVGGTVTTPDVNDGAGVWTLVSVSQPTLNRIQ